MVKFEVSVIIPVFNAEMFLEKSVLSAISQPETFEVLLIEDGSTDHSLIKCISLAERFPQVRLFRHKNGGNLGPSRSRNVGLVNAKGTFLSFLDADDYYLPNRFSNSKIVFGKYPGAVGVYENVQVFCLMNNQFRENLCLKQDFQPNSIFDAMVNPNSGGIHLNGLTINRNYVQGNKFFFDPELKLGQDIDFIMQISNGALVYPGSVNLPVAVVQKHKNNSSNVSLEIHSQYRSYLFRKWTLKIPDHDWSRSVSWTLVRHYLSYVPVVFKYSNIFIFRLILKSWFFIELIVSNPKIGLKLLK